VGSLSPKLSLLACGRGAAAQPLPATLHFSALGLLFRRLFISPFSIFVEMQKKNYFFVRL
ncbi:hypothetical protein, partial [Ralstonia pseudosolanacearum]|uniref:hypothetical protein n=1 Tax=Ralstonia pseudosolanacearum TaxID=1310165 RepID=UPI003CEC5250